KPDRKDVLSSIDISIMPCATLSTPPSSYSQTCSTFWTTVTYFKAARAGLGSVTLIYDLKLTTCMLAFIFQLSFKFKPSCIVCRFSQIGFLLVNERDLTSPTTIKLLSLTSLVVNL